MAGFKSMVAVMVFMVLASFQLQSTVAQTQHVVGGSSGWIVPPNVTAYTSWEASKTFRVGDTLLFNFNTGAHNVLEVSQSAYNSCTLANPISRYINGPATITLNTTGNHYYVCAVGPHCTLGQKVMVNVVAGLTSPAPSGSTPSTPNTTMSPSPSSASTLAGVVPVTFLAALALVF